MRSLDQAPDITRNSSDATSPVRAESTAEFARDVAARVLGFTASTPDSRLMVIAPSSFANALRAELGAAWPSARGDVIERDETRLDDAALRNVIETTLKARS